MCSNLICQETIYGMIINAITLCDLYGNSCVNKFNKYILISQSENYANAQAFCRTHLGTDLASLHNVDDFNEAKLLCQLNNADCWIGLNDIDAEGIWKWQDGTSLDFGKNTSGGIYPWSNFPNAQPNNLNGNEDCVSMKNDRNYTFNDDECDSVSQYFICNMPSELCVETQWNSTGESLVECGQYL